MATPRKLVVPALLVITALAAGSWYAYQLANHQDGALRVSGNIEATEVELSFKIPGRVEQRYVDEGQLVRKGQEVARLETRDLDAEVAARKAEVQAAEAALAELKAGSRPEEIEAAKAAMDRAAALLAELEAGSRPQEVAAAEAELSATRVERQRLESELTRSERLFAERTITPEEIERARAAYRVAVERYNQAEKRYDLVKEGPRKEQIEQARAALAQSRSQYALVKAGPRVETIAQAQARLQQAKAALDLAETRRQYADLRSPLTGVVLSKNVEPGEYVAPGTPVLTAADVENVWLRAYVDERDIGRGLVRWGQEVEVSTDAYPGKVYKGRISFISSEAEFTPKSVQTTKERVKLVYRIKIDVSNPKGELKPGLPADATIKE